MIDIGEIIRRKQDQLRGRPRNWKDDLSDWWRGLDFIDDVLWPLYGAFVFSYVVFVLVLVLGFLW